MQKNPSATQKEIAAEIGKSERTVKSTTIALQEKNIIQRVNGKRNGYLSIVDEWLKVQYIVNLKKETPRMLISLSVNEGSKYLITTNNQFIVHNS